MIVLPDDITQCQTKLLVLLLSFKLNSFNNSLMDHKHLIKLKLISLNSFEDKVLLLQKYRKHVANRKNTWGNITPTKYIL